MKVVNLFDIIYYIFIKVILLGGLGTFLSLVVFGASGVWGFILSIVLSAILIIWLGFGKDINDEEFCSPENKIDYFLRWLTGINPDNYDYKIAKIEYANGTKEYSPKVKVSWLLPYYYINDYSLENPMDRLSFYDRSISSNEENAKVIIKHFKKAVEKRKEKQQKAKESNSVKNIEMKNYETND